MNEAQGRQMNDSFWGNYSPTASEPWDVRRVVHLHRRAGFAATWGQIQRDLRDGPNDAVGRMLSGTARADQSADFDETVDVIGQAAVASGNPERLKAWWIYGMLFSPDPLGERLTLMWHNHFATSNVKVDDTRLMHQQNQIFRELGRAPFADLLRRVVKHPAILLWLDAEANRKEHPNENLARELMELFTLGEGHYTEDDVKEAARALTGWMVNRGAFRTVGQFHDGGEKTVLGHTGKHGGDDLLDILLHHSAVARRLAWRLCDTFMGEGAVSEEAIDELADGLRRHDLSVGWGVATILRSRVFFSDRNIATRVLGPVEYIVGSIQLLEALGPPPSTVLLAEQLSKLGQDLFYPPNVFGWDGGRNWLNTRSVIGRAEFAASLMAGELWGSGKPADVASLTRRYGRAVSRQEMVTFFCQLFFGQVEVESLRKPLAKICEHPDLTNDEAARQIVVTLMASPSGQLG